jgi:hypothetical protein
MKMPGNELSRYCCVVNISIFFKIQLKSNFKKARGERRRAMGDAIQWENDLGKVLSRAKAEKKPVLMDFFNPG